MRFGYPEARPPKTRRREGFHPRGESLELRQLLAIDLTNIAGSTTTGTPGPYGVLEGGLFNNGGAGFSVTVVGDTNGDGFNDFVVGAPTITSNATGVAIGSGAGGQAYLVFGSQQVTAQTFDFRNLVPQQRIGDLSALGQTIQSNPVNGAAGFAYDGLTFTTSQNLFSALGASVAPAGDVNGDGFADFLIGAPGGNDSSNTSNAAGRAYLVYGGANLNRPNKTVDLDNPTSNSDLNILTFVNNAPNAATGRAVAFAGDILADGLPDIAIGAPNATLNGAANSGAVYVISGAALRPARTQTISLQNTGQGGTNNIPGVVFTGSVAGDNAGFSIASGGNFAAATVNAQQQSTLVIGAPQFNVGPGQANLVYATAGLGAAGITTNNFTSIQLNRIGGSVNGISGAVFTGTGTNDRTGFAVSTAGDFNNDGVADILIGSPGFNTATGRVDLIYGRRATPTTPGAITGTVPLGAIPSGINSVEFDGASTGSLAGFSVTAVGLINSDTINEILIGSPGFNNSQGVAYLIPGNPDLQGTLSLANAEAQPIQGLIIGLSQPAGNPNFLGSSVGGLLGTNNQGRTVDGDTSSDFVIGAAGFALNSGRLGAGGAYLLEGAFVPLPNVVSTAITSPIGVGKALPPYSINATAPADLQIFVLSAGSNTADFEPFRDIDPTTLTVNGLAVPDPTTWRQETDQDGDGIPDASFVFSPRSLLNLPNGNVTFTVAGRTLSTSPFPNRRYTGTTSVTVTGGGGGGGGSGGLPSDRTVAFSSFGADNQSNLPNGERLVPSNAVLRRLHYKPIPIAVAHRQFYATNGFGYRNHHFYFPNSGKTVGYPTNPNRQNSGHGTYTLGRRVLSRGKFPVGTFKGHIKIKGPTIP